MSGTLSAALARLDRESSERAGDLHRRGVEATVRGFWWHPLLRLAREWRRQGLRAAVVEAYGELLTAAKLWELNRPAEPGEPAPPLRGSVGGFQRIRAGRLVAWARPGDVEVLRALVRCGREALGEERRRGSQGMRVELGHGRSGLWRPYRRGGRVAWLGDRYFGWPRRPARELGCLARARAGGAPVPEPLGAVVESLGWGWYRGAILTEAVEEASTLWDRWCAADRDERRALARALGSAVRRLQDAGVWHPDLHPRNLLCSGPAACPSVVVVDLDRGRARRRPLGRWLRSRNRRRFWRALDRLDPEGSRLDPADRTMLALAAGGAWEVEPAPRRVLIVLHGAVGDVVRALPLLGQLRRAFPAAHMAWAVEPGAEPLVRNHPWVDELVVYPRGGGLRAVVAFVRRVRSRRFDTVLDLQRHLRSGLVTRLSGAPRRVGFHRRNGREGNWLAHTHHLPPLVHLSSKLRQFVAFGRILGIDDGEIGFGLEPDADSRAWARERLEGREPAAVFFLGSTCESRRWFADRTAEVAERLRGEWGLHPVLVGTAADRAFAAAVLAAMRAPALDLTGATTLPRLVAVLARAALAIGPDTGTMHIAAALGVPVISLWGATSPARSVPERDGHTAVIGSAACSPCYLRRCPIGRWCMREITADAVVGKAAAAMRGRGWRGAV